MGQTPKRHVDRFSRFCIGHPCAQHTDTQTTLRATSVEQAACDVTWPGNNFKLSCEKHIHMILNLTFLILHQYRVYHNAHV